MKRNLLLGLSLIAIFSSPIYAMEIVGGKLISHKETASSQVKASFQDLKLAESFKPKFHNKVFKQPYPLPEQVIDVTTHALPVAPVTLPGYVSLYGDQQYFIENNSSIAQTYLISTVICENLAVGEGMAFDNCASSVDDVQLEAGGYVRNHPRSSLGIRLDKAEFNYIEYVDIQIMNAAGTIVYTSEDRQPITVIPPGVKK